MNLEELELSLLDVLAVAVAGGEVCGGEAVMGAVPAVFAGAA